MTYLLALDQGTSSSRSIVFDADGRVVAVAQRELTQHFPQPGWVEHDPLEIWETQLATAREALQKARITARDIRAVGITNQRETTVLWHRRTGQPLSGIEHVRQSIEDILTTPLGSRRMRPEYGSKLRRFVDLPVNDGWKSAVQAEVASTLGRWEPRLKLQRVRVLAVVGGQISLQLSGQYLGDSHLLEVSA